MILIAVLAAAWQVQIWFGHSPELHGSRWITVPCGLLMTVPLIARRKWPLGAAALVYSAGILQTAALGVELPAGFLISTLMSAFAVGAYLDGRRSWTALGLCVAATGAIAVLDPTNEGPESVVLIAMVFAGAPWMVGRMVCRMGRQHRALESMTVRLEHEREQNARASVLEERSRIARELHDIIAHSLSVMVIQAGAAGAALDHDPALARPPIEAIRTTGQQALIEMRRLLGILRTDEPPMTLAPQPGLGSLDFLVCQARDAGLAVDVAIGGSSVTLPTGLDVALYRVVQEALTNVRKHARASKASVEICFDRSAVEVIVADDGSAVPDPRAEPGHGLIGMRERVSLYGGTFDAGPGADGGWRVRARLPITV
jgi:signal transduction histidine kinase